MEASANFESALRDSFRGAVHANGGETPPAAAAAQETPAAEPATPVEPASPEPAPAVPVAPEVPTTDGNNPPAAPVQAKPEGGTPPDQPTPPASDVQTKSDYQKWLDRYGNDPERAAREAFALESRHAALVKQQKAATNEPQPAVAAQEPTNVQPRPQATAPAPVQTVPTTEPTVEVEQRVRQLLDSDPECKRLASQYLLVENEKEAIYKADEFGRPVGGRFVELNTQIQTLETMLLPADRLRQLGIEIQPLDDLSRAQAEQKLTRLEVERQRLENRYTQLDNAEKQLSSAYESRRHGHRSRIEQEAQSRRAEADFAAEVDLKAATFQSRWMTAEESALKTHNVPDDMKADVHQALKRAAAARLALNDAIPLEELHEFLGQTVKEQMDLVDKYHRQKSAVYAKVKAADAHAATPGPTGAAAVAPPAPTDNKDWEKALQANMRSARRGLKA